MKQESKEINSSNSETQLDGIDFATGTPNNIDKEKNGKPEEIASVTEEKGREKNGTEGESEDENQDSTKEAEFDHKKLEEARKEIEILQDSWSRERAEFINFRKRTQQEYARSRVTTVADFFVGLLPALDHLDTVLKTVSENEELQNFIAGVSMIRQEIIAVVEKYQIHVLNPVDKPFDPEFMEAIDTETREDLDQDTVIESYQDGFYLEFDDGQRKVLRPARVKVGKAV